MADRPRNPHKTMANETSFDLNAAIQRWRENLGQSPAFRSENLNELESHLRDSVESLHTGRLSDEEAFIIAAKRMGTGKALEGEFGKLNGAAVWFEPALWILLATQLWSVIRSLSTIGLCVGTWFVRILNWNHAVSEDWLNAVVGAIFSPLVVAIVAACIWRNFVWRRQRKALFLHKLLQHPVNLALILFLFCALFRVAAGYLFRGWYEPMFYHTLGYNPQIGPLIIQLYEYVILAALTYFVARKRLRAVAA